MKKHVSKLSVGKADAMGEVQGWVGDNATAIIAGVVSLVAGIGLGAGIDAAAKGNLTLPSLK